MTNEEQAKQEFDILCDYFGKTVEGSINKQTGAVDWFRIETAIGHVKARIKAIAHLLPVNLPIPDSIQKETPP